MFMFLFYFYNMKDMHFSDILHCYSSHDILMFQGTKIYPLLRNQPVSIVVKGALKSMIHHLEVFIVNALDNSHLEVAENFTDTLKSWW